MFDINKIRDEFPILKTAGGGKPYAYLDSAATAQKPESVIAREADIYRTVNSNIHRGVHRLSNLSTVAYEDARATVARFIGAADDAEVIFTSGATASLNLVASSWGSFLKKGDEIIVTEMEHHSNIVPWQFICGRTGAVLKVAPVLDDGALDMEALRSLINDRTKVVAVTHCSNVLGTVNDVTTICSWARSAGAVSVIDGCQGIVHQKIDVQAIGCDFYAFSGHKLYGPTGIGVLYGRRGLLEKMPPFMGGGDMVAHVAFEKTTYAALPFKFEAGTANYVGAIAFAEAVRFIERVGADAVAAHEKGLIGRAMHAMSSVKDIKIYGTLKDKGPILSFNVKGVHHQDLGMILDKQNVAVRTGTLCAEPIMTRFGVKGMVRASFAVYNTSEEVDMLVRATEVAVGMLK